MTDFSRCQAPAIGRVSAAQWRPPCFLKTRILHDLARSRTENGLRFVLGLRPRRRLPPPFGGRPPGLRPRTIPCWPRSTASEIGRATSRSPKRSSAPACRWTRHQEGQRAVVPDRHSRSSPRPPRTRSSRSNSEDFKRRICLHAQPPADGQPAGHRRQGRDHRRGHEEASMRRPPSRWHRRTGSARPPHSGRIRGRRPRRSSSRTGQGWPISPSWPRRSRRIPALPTAAISAIFTKEQMVPEFSAVAFTLAPGKISEAGQDAVRLAHHQGRGQAQPPGARLRLRSSRPQIETYVTRKAQAEYVADLRSKTAKIERVDNAGETAAKPDAKALAAPGRNPMRPPDSKHRRRRRSQNSPSTCLAPPVISRHPAGKPARPFDAWRQADSGGSPMEGRHQGSDWRRHR